MLAVPAAVIDIGRSSLFNALPENVPVWSARSSCRVSRAKIAAVSDSPLAERQQRVASKRDDHRFF